MICDSRREIEVRGQVGGEDKGGKTITVGAVATGRVDDVAVDWT
jgi:hypothetical protein